MPGIAHDHYRQAAALFESGRLEESLEHFEAFLKERPISGKAWNGAGTVLFRLGQHEKAARYFQRSIEQQDRPAEAWRNLICTYLALGQPGRAMQWLKTVDHEVHADVSLVCHTARAFEQQSDAASAMSILQYGKRLDGDMTRLQKQIEQLRSRRAKIAFSAGGVNAQLPEAIVEYMQQRYPVRVYEGRDAADIQELMQWCDICWFEGWGEVTETGTYGAKICKTIVRLRENDLESLPEAVNWGNVDVIAATGCSEISQALGQRYRQLQADVPVVTIADGIDVDKITFKRRRQGKRIAIASVEGCQAEILRCTSELLRQHADYQFHDMGNANDSIMRKDISFIVSTGDTEGVRKTVYEAMACGIKPVVRDFPGAATFFGKNYLFRTPEEFCSRILEEDYNSEEYRFYVEKKCPLSRCLLQIDEIFAAFESLTKGAVPRTAAVQQSAEVTAAV
jgi:tetratricopeptide (TPR) repeat protein